jgi:hypothetical protein
VTSTPPTVAELADRYGVTIEQVLEAHDVSTAHHPVSLDASGRTGRLRVFERRGHITVTMHPEWAREIERFIAERATVDDGIRFSAAGRRASSR